MNDNEKFIQEMYAASMERTIKRLWITIILLIVLLVGSNICWIVYENQFEDGRSYRNSYNRGGSYRGSSYARGRGSNAKRDSMGRYSSRGYSMDEGMVAELHELMEDAPDEKTRLEFQKFIRKIESM